ncbi:MAG: VOC family protein, partial [Candidatus Sericytochromatia bacterium]
MKFRIARHTNNLEPLINFYTNYLGLELLGRFKNHSSYDGIFLGKKDLDWHLEFTMSDEKANHIFDEDDLLVFYDN